MTTGLIMCGALGHEVVDMINKYQWDAEILGVSAMDHMFPDRIAPDVEQRILAYREKYERLIVVFGDCGSQGALDRVLSHHHDIERIAGPHCYEMYGGKMFHELMEEEPGTFFLTDFLVRGFQGTIMKGLGLDRFPHLKEDYFRNYKRLVYFVQKATPELHEKVAEIGEYLNLPVEIRETGYNLLEERLVALMEKDPPKRKAGSMTQNEPILKTAEPAPNRPRWNERHQPPSERRRKRKHRRKAKTSES